MNIIKSNEDPKLSAFITADIKEKQILYGKAGTGKTHSLIMRVKHLLIDLEQDEKILILSFTRNAVREIKERLNLKGIEAYQVDILTFDKFASRILMKSTNNNWIHINYDISIMKATELIKTAKLDSIKKKTTIANLDLYKEELDSYKHLLIDEIQDLNLLRAELVTSILEYLKNQIGFSLFGDYNQEIYGYQAEKKKDARFSRAEEFKDHILKEFHPIEFEKIITIEQNPRFKHFKEIELLKKIEDFLLTCMKKGKKCTSDELQNIYMMKGIENVLNTSEEYFLVDIHKITTEVDQNHFPVNNSKIAILCRNNSEAELISCFLHENQIKHNYFIDKDIYPPWIARVLQKCDLKCDKEKLFLEKEKMFKIWDDIKDYFPSNKIIQKEKIWELFVMLALGKNVDFNRISKISVDTLISKIRIHFDDKALEDLMSDRANLIVSTIHKSKGREYRRVIFKAYRPNKTNIEEEVRIHYVGLTRAMEKMYLLKYMKIFDVNEVFSEKVRELKKNLFFLGNYDITKKLEKKEKYFLNVDPLSFIDKDINKAKSKQDYIWSKVKIGDPIRIMVNFEGIEKYARFIHQNHDIGSLSNEALELLEKWINTYKIDKKCFLKGGRIIAITSEIFPTFGKDMDLNRIPDLYKVLKCWNGFRTLGFYYTEE
jgi:hypothetical protein